MKTKSVLRLSSVVRGAAFLLVSALGLQAAPLPGTTAVHTQPNDQAPTITVLAAGTEPTVAEDEAASTPDGWLAVELPGPFEVYVPNKDITKSLDVRPGAALHLAPKEDAAVISTAAPDDSLEITGLHGKWTQLKLERKITGFIRTGPAPEPAKPAASTAAATPAPRNDAAPLSPAPVAPTAYGSAGGRPASAINLAGTAAASLPRHFRGKFVSTRSPFKPRRPYDWALNDDAGKRYAYLDIKSLLLTEQIESYIGHTVVVFGAATPTPDGKDFVIQVESLQLQ